MLADKDSTNEARERRRSAVLALLFAVIALLAGLDFMADIHEGVGMRHAAVELALVLAGLTGLRLMLRRFVRLRRQSKIWRDETQALTARLDAKTAEAARWRDEAHLLIEGLGAAIDRQFERWALTPAEKEVGLLLLKGLSHKEVAGVRGIGEPTARQQARSVYRKAELTGRHALSAFFLEDLLLPAEAISPPSSEAANAVNRA